MRLDNLETLVHHRRAIQGDLCSHIPVRMSRGLLLHSPRVGFAHFEQLILRQVAERSPARRQYNSPESTWRHALQTLEYSAVLTVCGEHVHTVLLHQGIDHRPTADERLLVRQGDVLPELDRLDRREESRGADYARHDGVGCRHRRGLDDAVGAVDDLGHIVAPLPLEDRLELGRRLGSGERSHARPVLHDLLGHEGRVVPRRERVDDEVIGTGVDYVERLGTDAARRAQDANALLEGGALEGLVECLLQRFGRVDGGAGVDPSLAGAGRAGGREDVERRRLSRRRRRRGEGIRRREATRRCQNELHVESLDLGGFLG
mmetsp:Transcript_25280/g.56730  ORF Transcript_25280/g.56730 Transcript_25280/m.56730 type:complete len:318 (-) Transcript_25280:161-1114(-)